MAYITDRLALLVESTGFEVPVTLVVSGTVIIGTLAPVRRYIDWQTEVLHRSARGGGTFIATTQEMPGPTETQRQAVEDSWRERVGDLDPADEVSFPEICLRNAEVRSGAASTWQRCPFLLVQSDLVGAATLGHFRSSE
jgi:hypothetical protein